MLYSARVVGPHKGGDAETPANRNFEWQLARLLVVSEHTIRMLKSRWSSLRDLRLQLRSSDDVVFAFKWFVVYSLTDGCRLLFVCRRPPRIVDRFTVSVFTPDSSQWASVHTYLHIS